MWTRSAAALAALTATATLAAQSPTFNVGRAPTREEILALGAAIAPDGSGLPEGSGSVSAGREVFAAHCSRCHGPNAEGDVGPRLVGGQGTLATPRPLKTVGSFWPYATTLFDYIRRAMPYPTPGSLNNDEIYAVVAYILSLNGILPADGKVDRENLPNIKMPNRDGFIPDPEFDPQRIGKK